MSAKGSVLTPTIFSTATSPSAEFYRKLLNELSDAVYFVDRKRVITFWNRASERVTGYSAAEVLGRCCADNILCHVDECGTQLCTSGCPLTHAMDDRNAHTADVYLRHRAGHRVPVSVRVSPILNEGGELLGAVEVFSDVSTKKSMYARLAELQEAAFVDVLTGLPNRRHLEQALSRMHGDLQRYDRPFGILLFDVDEFKTVNDSYGHPVGDAVLSAVAKTVAATLRTSDLFGRWGGEEFLALLPEIDGEQLWHCAERCRSLFSRVGVPNFETRVGVTVSCGVVLVSDDESPDAAISRADRCLYSSKQGGRNRTTIDEGREVSPKSAGNDPSRESPAVVDSSSR